jgi:hypothetical protein
MTLSDFHARFKYRADVADRWSLLTAPTGSLVGDCDDFALTSAWIISGGSWPRLLWSVLTLRCVMWFVIASNGQGHMALWVRGRGWTCCVYPQFGPLRHKRRMPYIMPIFLVGLIVKRLTVF